MAGRRFLAGTNKLRDSWGGWVVLCLAVGVAATAAATTFVDGRLFTMTDAGRLRVSDGGNAGLLVSVTGLGGCLLGTAIALARPAVFQARAVSSFTWPMLALLMWWSMSAALRGESFRSLLASAGLLVLAFGVVAAPPTLRTVRHLHWVLDFVVLTSLLASIMLPAAQAECREDKCGIFGAMFFGIFEHENVLAGAVVLLLPSLITASTRHLLVSSVASTLAIGASGSRTGFIATAIALSYVLTYRTRVRSGGVKPPSALWRLLPLICLVGSLILLMTVRGSDLTARGEIYQYVLAQINNGDDWSIGPGTASLSGMLGGWIQGTHGVAPRLLVVAGIPGLVFALLGMAGLVFPFTWNTERTVATGFVVTMASRFLTEEELALDILSFSAVALLLSMGLFATNTAVNSPRRRRRRMRALGLGDGGTPDLVPRSSSTTIRTEARSGARIIQIPSARVRRWRPMRTQGGRATAYALWPRSS